MKRLLPRFMGARVIKTGLAVSLATGLMSFVDPTHGLVGAGVSAALMIAPDEHSGKEWARTQFIAVLAGSLVGAIFGGIVGWAPWLSGVAAMLLILFFSRTGYTGAVVSGLGNALFILEHTDRGLEYALFRFGASVAGLVVGWLVNRYVLPYRAPKAAKPAHASTPMEAVAD